MPGTQQALPALRSLLTGLLPAASPTTHLRGRPGLSPTRFSFWSLTWITQPAFTDAFGRHKPDKNPGPVDLTVEHCTTHPEQGRATPVHRPTPGPQDSGLANSSHMGCRINAQARRSCHDSRRRPHRMAALATQVGGGHAFCHQPLAPQWSPEEVGWGMTPLRTCHWYPRSVRMPGGETQVCPSQVAGQRPSYSPGLSTELGLCPQHPAASPENDRKDPENEI